MGLDAANTKYRSEPLTSIAYDTDRIESNTSKSLRWALRRAKVEGGDGKEGVGMTISLDTESTDGAE
eukprot:9803380-Alexandrium_andersonii.AAC.1